MSRYLEMRPLKVIGLDEVMRVEPWYGIIALIRKDMTEFALSLYTTTGENSAYTGPLQNHADIMISDFQPPEL